MLYAGLVYSLDFPLLIALLIWYIYSPNSVDTTSKEEIYF